jgi:SAM-dependent methyltransferase
MPLKRNVAKFNHDVRSNDGYMYTSNARLSSVWSNARISRAVFDIIDVRGKCVLDFGCGDGAYSQEFLQRGAAHVLGVDPATDAVDIAKRRLAPGDNIDFRTLDSEGLSGLDERYDVAVARGVFHHLNDAEAVIGQLCLIADAIVVVEPNGYNPVLKIIEKTSRYHLDHEEKSYPPRLLDRWFKNHGARVDETRFVGQVPFFCPDWLARLLKRCEPLVERVPGLRAIACAQYVMRISTSPRSRRPSPS